MLFFGDFLQSAHRLDRSEESFMPRQQKIKKWGNFPLSLSNFSGSNDVAHPRDCIVICRKQGAWWVFVWRSYLIKRICDSSVWHEWLWAFLSYRLVALVICIKFCKIIATSFCRWLPVFQCSLMQKCTCTVCYRTSGSALVRWLT